MTITELIAQLEAIKAEHGGDTEVFFSSEDCGTPCHRSANSAVVKPLFAPPFWGGTTDTPVVVIGEDWNAAD